MDEEQAIKEFIEQSGLAENGIDQTSLDEWQDQCVRLALGIKEWVNGLELRLTSIEHRIDRLEEK